MPSHPAGSRLDAFCLANRIRTGELANAAKLSRQHVNRLRRDAADTRIKVAKEIARGASRIVGRKVPVAELFDLDFDV